VKSYRSPRFNKAFEKLGREVQEIAREQYRKFEENPYGPGVDFHAIKGTKTRSSTAHSAFSTGKRRKSIGSGSGRTKSTTTS
jgi:hypothetical protein